MVVTVVKVGGSLLGDEADLRRVASAIAEKRRGGGPLLVVASALRGVTDQLDQVATQAREGRPQNGALEDLHRRHLEITREVADGVALERTQAVLNEVESLAGAIRSRRELSDATYARLLSSGERLSVALLAAAIQEAGQDARPVAAEEADLRAQGPARNGCCDIPASAPGFRRLHDHLRGPVLVLTGFYGIGGDGGTVLFGRGGSDDTACAVAAGLGAGRLELWKDVPGLMSADPRHVQGARVIRELSFAEAAQLGAYGSRIVNHGCLDPLRGRSIQVLVSSVPGDGSGTGTLLVEKLRRGATRVVALASRKGDGQSLIGLVGDGVAGDPGIRARMLSCLAAAGAGGDLVAEPSGSSGLSCTLHPEDLNPALSSLHESFFNEGSPRRRP